MSNFRIVVEEDAFWKEVKEEYIKGDIYCPVCKSILIIIPVMYSSLAYCPKCRKYLELMKKCKKCGEEYSVSEIHFCNSYSLIDKK